MKHKIIFIILSAVILLTASVYLIVLNTGSITGNVIAENGQAYGPEGPSRPGDCWTLDDGRRVCYLGTSEVSNGELTTSDGIVEEGK